MSESACGEQGAARSGLGVAAQMAARAAEGAAGGREELKKRRLDESGGGDVEGEAEAVSIWPLFKLNRVKGGEEDPRFTTSFQVPLPRDEIECAGAAIGAFAWQT